MSGRAHFIKIKKINLSLFLLALFLVENCYLQTYFQP